MLKGINIKSGINSSALKIMAMILMLIDHIGALIVLPYMMTVTDYELYQRLHSLYDILRLIGRVAMPIFVYQLVLGNRFTKNKSRYILNILIFTLISEIPYNFLLSDSIIDIKDQSIMWALLLGALMMACLDLVNKEKVSIIYSMLIVLITCVIAYFIRSDYGFSAIILIASIYFLIDHRELMIYISPVVFLLSYFLMKYMNPRYRDQAVERLASEAMCVVAFIFIANDNGIRKGGKTLKWIGYLFYPLHLTIIYLIRRFILKF